MKFSIRAIPAAAAITAALVLGTQVHAQTPSPAAGDMQPMSPPHTGAMPANPQQGDSAKPMRQPGMTNKSNTPKATKDEETASPGSIQQRNAGKQPMRESGMTNKLNNSNAPKATKDEETASPGSTQQRDAGKQPMRQQGMGNKSDGTKPRTDQETANPGAGSGR